MPYAESESLLIDDTRRIVRDDEMGFDEQFDTLDEFNSFIDDNYADIEWDDDD